MSKKTKNDYSFNDIKAMLLQEKKKYDEEQEWKATVKKVYSKPRVNYNKLSASVKKSAHQSPGGLDLHKDENRYYSKGETERWLSGTSYFENYQAMRDQDDY